MLSLIRLIGRNLRATLIGADPAAPRRRLRPLAAGIWVVVMVGLAALNVQNLKDARDMPLLIAAGIGLLAVLPLVFVRDKPLWAWRIAALALFAGAIDRGENDAWAWTTVQMLVLLAVLFAVALRESVGVILWVGVLTTMITWILASDRYGNNVVGVTLLLAAILLFGEQIQRRRRAQLDLRAETERTKIARELHDVVAHSMSLVAVRAETAPYRLPGLPETAREEFAALAVTARESLTELRRLLGVLRTDGDAARAPQPTLSDVDELVATMRAAGMEISYTPTHAEVTPATGLTIYRVVQEALSNAARHAPGAPVKVTLDSKGKALAVTIRNGLTEAPSHAAGHGLTGMRERVELLGGSLGHGLADESFEVKAVIPVD